MMTDNHDDALGCDATSGAEGLPIEVIAVWRATGGWHLETLLYREPGGEIQTHPLSSASYSTDPSIPIETQWSYLAERVADGRGGNAYSWEVEGWSVATIEDIAPTALSRATLVSAATFGPLGEIKGTVLMSGPGFQPKLLMPFMILRDTKGHLALVLTDESKDPMACTVRHSSGQVISPTTFESHEHPKLAQAPSWRVHEGGTYDVSWNDEKHQVAINGEGQLELGDGMNATVPEPVADGSESPQGSVGSEGRPGEATQSGAPSRYERVSGTPQWVWDTSDHKVVEKRMDATGGQPNCTYSTPWIYRALASPHTHERVLAAPTASDDHSAVPYWHALLQILRFSLGWARPDRGLRWWYDAGKPVDDPMLQFVADVWEADGQLDWFAAWLWTTRDYGPATSRFSELLGYHDDQRRVEVDTGWLRFVDRQAVASGIDHQGSGNHDPLHLSAHADGPLEEPCGGAEMYHGDPAERRAVLMLESMRGWYAALARHGAMLPDIGKRSWCVEVVVRPVGSLGTFRRSRASRLWFSSFHRSHLPGT